MPLTSIYEKYESPIFHYNNVSTYTLKQSFDPSRTPESVKISFHRLRAKNHRKAWQQCARQPLENSNNTGNIEKPAKSSVWSVIDTVRTHVSAEYIGTSVVCLYKPTGGAIRRVSCAGRRTSIAETWLATLIALIERKLTGHPGPRLRPLSDVASSRDFVLSVRRASVLRDASRTVMINTWRSPDFHTAESTFNRARVERSKGRGGKIYERRRIRRISGFMEIVFSY